MRLGKRLGVVVFGHSGEAELGDDPHHLEFHGDAEFQRVTQPAHVQDSAGCGRGPAPQCLITIIAYARGFALDEEADRRRTYAQPGAQTRTNILMGACPGTVEHLN